MSEDIIKTIEELPENQYPEPDIIEATETIKQVEEIKEAVQAVTDTSLPEKVVDLRDMLEHLSDEVDSWKTWHKKDYQGAIETLKSQVEEIHQEWGNVSSNLNSQREKLESLLQSAPGIIETSTLKALSLRVAHLEKLISQIFNETQTNAALKSSKKQFIISIVALVVTIILWMVFIIMNLLK
jgi:DNA repair exonuclease SbcCD ATPase subunit